MCWVLAAPTTRAARCGLTWQKSAEVVVPAGNVRGWAGKGRTSSGASEAVLLVPVTVIAAIPRDAGLLWEGTVHVR